MEISGDLQIVYPVFRRMTLSAIAGWLRPARIGGTVLLVVLLFLALALGSIQLLFEAILLSALVFGFPEFIAVLGWLTQRHLLSRPMRYMLTAAGLQVHSPTTHVQVDWSGVRRVRRRRDVWLIRHAGPQQVVLPRAAFSPADREVIDQFFAERFSAGRTRAAA